MKYVKLGLRFLLGALFVLAGIYHFVNPAFYVKLMPPYLPANHSLVLLSGVTEVIAGAMMFLRPTLKLGAWGIVAMLVIFLLVHVHMLLHAEQYPGVPLWALWLRLMFQFLFIAWAWWYTRPDKHHEGTPA